MDTKIGKGSGFDACRTARGSGVTPVVLTALLAVLLGGPAAALRAADSGKPAKDDAPAGSEKGDAKGGEDSDEYVVFTNDHPLGTVKPGQALLYVVRPTHVGFAIKSFFFVNDTISGINRGSSYFFLDIPPGKHVLWSKSENVDALEMTFEAGKTYYLQQQVQLGWGRARTKLEVLEGEKGPEALAKCSKHGVMKEAGVKLGQEYAATLKTNVQEDLDRRAREAAEEQKKAEAAAQKKKGSASDH